MDDGDKQQAPPPVPHNRHQRTITVVRGNHSLGMFSVFLVALVSWCVYVVVMAMVGGGGGDPQEEL
jgi:hypothetical protein